MCAWWQRKRGFRVWSARHVWRSTKQRWHKGARELKTYPATLNSKFAPKQITEIKYCIENTVRFWFGSPRYLSPLSWLRERFSERKKKRKRRRRCNSLFESNKFFPKTCFPAALGHTKNKKTKKRGYQFHILYCISLESEKKKWIKKKKKKVADCCSMYTVFNPVRTSKRHIRKVWYKTTLAAVDVCVSLPQTRTMVQDPHNTCIQRNPQCLLAAVNKSCTCPWSLYQLLEANSDALHSTLCHGGPDDEKPDNTSSPPPLAHTKQRVVP